MLLGKGSVVSLEQPTLTVHVKDDSLLEILREANRFRLTVYLTEAEARTLVGNGRAPVTGSPWRGALNVASKRLTLKADAAAVTSAGGEMTIDLTPSEAKAFHKRQGPSDGGASR
ncbi:hypothetical protein D3C72_1982050 [compost metagenome]